MDHRRDCFLIFGATQTDWLQSTIVWQKADGELINRRYVWRLEKPADTNIVLMGLNSSSLSLSQLAPEEIAASPILQLMQEPWPWNRRVHAAVLEKLMNAGAKVVVFDFVFAGEKEGDEVFAEALQKYRERVVIGSMFQSGEFLQYTAPNERLLLPGTESSIGFVNLWSDGDEVVRHGKYRTSIERESPAAMGKFPSLEAFLIRYPDDLTHIAPMAVRKFTGQPVSLPPDDHPNFIDFQGQPGTYKPLPVEEMFVEKLWQGRAFDNGMVFSNKIVVFGPITEILHDIHATPLGRTPGPEIQVQIMSALLEGSWLTGTTDTVDMVLALVFMWLALEICLRISNALLKVVALVGSVIIFLSSRRSPLRTTSWCCDDAAFGLLDGHRHVRHRFPICARTI